MELTGEYVGCDGEPRRLRVSCEASEDANPLQSLSAGVARMKELVAEFFGPLVERDAQGATADPVDAVDGERGGGAPGVSGVGRLCEGQLRESERASDRGSLPLCLVFLSLVLTTFHSSPKTNMASIELGSRRRTESVRRLCSWGAQRVEIGRSRGRVERVAVCNRC